MNKLIGTLAILLTVGCYIGTDAEVPTGKEIVEPTNDKEEMKLPPIVQEEDVDSGNCENAYQVLVFHEETTNTDVIVLIPIPCDPRPFIDLGRPAPITL